MFIVVYIVAIGEMISVLIGLTLDQLYFAEKIKIWLARCICYLFATKVPDCLLTGNIHIKSAHYLRSTCYMYLIRSPYKSLPGPQSSFWPFVVQFVRDEKLSWGLEMRVNNSYSFQNCGLHFREEPATVLLKFVCFLAQCAWRSIFLHCWWSMCSL